MRITGLLITFIGLCLTLLGRTGAAHSRGLLVALCGVVLSAIGFVSRQRSIEGVRNVISALVHFQWKVQARVDVGGRFPKGTLRSRAMQWLHDFVYDIRFGYRMLSKSAGYTIAAIFALSIGIGPNTAFFTLFNAIFLRPMPVPLSEGVVVFEKITPGRRFPNSDFSQAEYEYYRDHNTTLEAISVYVSFQSKAPGSDRPASGLIVSSSYFSVMGVEPVVGHRFTSADDVQTAPPYPAMLSENFWERQFGRDAQILSRHLVFDDTPVVIVGITPRDFMGSRPGVPDVWLPFGARSARQCCRLEGRLKAGVIKQRAEAELTQLAYAFHAEALRTNDPDWTIGLSAPTPGIFRNSTLYRDPSRNFTLFSIFQTATGLVLLIGCANASGLLLGKAVSRQKEIAIRLSLGSSRGRLLRQLLTEALLIALAAGVIGLLMSWWILSVLIQMALSTLAGFIGGSALLNLTPDFRILLYTLAASTITAVGFSLLPALQATKLNLTEALKDEFLALSGKRRHDFGGPVSAQVAISVMLLIAAAALVGSSGASFRNDFGFDVERVLAIAVPTSEQSRELQARLYAFSDVASISSASGLPLSGQRALIAPVLPKPNAALEDQARAPQQPLMFVSYGYFETLGIGVLQGRSFTQQEISSRAPVAIISRTLANQLWPKDNPIGKTMTVGSRPENSTGEALPYFPSVDVIGVVGDVTATGLTASSSEALYLPSPSGSEANIFVRASRDPKALLANLSREMRSSDRTSSLSVRTMNSVVDSNPTFLVLRTVGAVFSAIGLLGLFLAAAGIYSMVSYAVSQQTQEIGIRMALGAHRSNIVRMLLGRSIRPVGQGLAAGIGLGIIVSLLMSRLFEQVRFIDFELLVVIPGILLAIALIAAYVPTRKATKLDPSAALRRT